MGVREHGSIDDVGEAAFEDSEGFKPAVAVGPAASDEGTGVRVPVRLGGRDAV